jgi:protein O-GlcNAc transferase
VNGPAAKGARERLAAALAHHRAGRLAEAQSAYRRILAEAPRNADALHMLGVIALQTGGHDEAVELIRQAIGHNAGVPAFHNNLGNALKALGRLEEGEAAYRRALELKPDHAEAHYNLGIVLHARGALAEAVASFQRALGSRAGHPQTHFALANALREQGSLEEALAAYGHALSLAPDYAEAHANSGGALEALGRYGEAAAAYRRALACRPGFAAAQRNLGAVLLELGRAQDAADACAQAVELEPRCAEAHCTLGHALRDCGRQQDAVAAYRRAIELDPDCAGARLGLAVAAVPLMTDSAEESASVPRVFLQAVEELRAWTRSHPGKLEPVIGSAQPFHLPYGHRDVTAALCAYGDLIRAEAAAEEGRGRPGRAEGWPPRERVRLALVSGHVRRHPVWDVISRGIVSELDRKGFEVFIYHTGGLADAETEWARRHADRFIQGPMRRCGWLERLEQDRPDVILYPELGMDPMSCALAARRLAPVQAAAWGHPVTTGLPSIDFYLSGELLEPPGAQAHYREELLRLPGTGVYTCWRDPPAQSWGGPQRKAGVVRFALCQQPIKADPGDDRLFARIARSAGPCELWLAAPKNLPWAAPRLRERMAAAFRREGLDPDAHLRTLEWLSPGAFADFLDSMDVFLDCPAFSGYTTAWQALHRGLPVVTWAGPFLRQRLAAGLLAHAGITEGIADSAQSYVETAARWAEEARRADRGSERREALRRLAGRADHNGAAIRALEERLLAAVRAVPATGKR